MDAPASSLRAHLAAAADAVAAAVADADATTRELDDATASLVQARALATAQQQQLALAAAESVRETERRVDAARELAALREAFEEELWRVSARLHDKARVAVENEMLHTRLAAATAATSANEAARAEAACTGSARQAPLSAHASLSSGEHLLCGVPDAAFRLVVAFCSPASVAALSGASRALLGRVSYALHASRRALLLELANSSSGSGSDGTGSADGSAMHAVHAAAQVAKDGILRAVNAIHAWSPHLGPQSMPQVAAAPTSDGLQTPMPDLSLPSSVEAAPPAPAEGAFGTLGPASAAAPRSRAGSFGAAGGMFGFGIKRNLQASAVSPAVNGGPLVALTPARPAAPAGAGAVSASSASTLASGSLPAVLLQSKPGPAALGSLFGSPARAITDEGVDFRKVEELVVKLKIANASLVGAKRAIDDMTMKVETADGVKRYLAQKVKQLEEAVGKATHEKDAALHEKSQNLEVIRFLDERVAGLEARALSAEARGGELEAQLHDMSAAANGAQLRLAQADLDVGAALGAAAERLAQLQAADARLAASEARAATLEQLAMGMTPDLLLGSGDSVGDASPLGAALLSRGGASSGSLGGAAHDTAVEANALDFAAERRLRTRLEESLQQARADLAAARADADARAARAAQVGGAWSEERGELSSLKLEVGRARKERDEARTAAQSEREHFATQLAAGEAERASLDAALQAAREAGATAPAPSNSAPAGGDEAGPLRAELERLKQESAAGEAQWKAARSLLAREVKKLRAERADLCGRLGVAVPD